MNRRTLTTVALLGLAVATVLPQIGFAQSVPLNMVGTWKLNLEKSKFSPGTALRSTTNNMQQDGQTIRNTSQGTDAGGNSFTVVYMHIYDGQPHPTTGAFDYDASAYTRVDASTEIFGRFKDGKLVAVGTITVSPDGKTQTVTTTGTGSTAASATGITVWDKQ